MTEAQTRSGGQALVEELLTHGVDTAFCVPGESYLAALDALGDVRDEIRLIVCRHEAAACHMAEAYGKLTGRPGICFVTRGPGASHAAVGVHTARQDSTPLILIIGQANSGTLDREAFQEVDFRAMFTPLAKWAAQVDNPERIPEYLSRAFHTAVNGRPGPVVLSIPENVLSAPCSAPGAETYRVAQSAPSEADLNRLTTLLDAAERPLIILGGGGWTAQARADIAAFAARAATPVAVTFRRQDLFDNDSPLYAGVLGLGTSPDLSALVARSDLLLVVGDRLSETATGAYKLIERIAPTCQLIHIHPDPDELGRVYQSVLPIACSPKGAAAALAQVDLSSTQRETWLAEIRAAHAPMRAAPPEAQDPNIGAMVTQLCEMLPPEAIISNGAGAYAAFVHRYHRYRAWPTQLAPASGSMGYGLPAAIAAKIVYPDRPAVCFAGDGCFLMSGQELATAVRYGLPIIVVVINNDSYGSIRMHQDRRYPDRAYATELENPDFVALAQAYGAEGTLVSNLSDFTAAVERALAAGGPSLIEIRTDIDEMLAQSPRKR